MAESDVVTLPIPNEREVSELAEKLCGVLDMAQVSVLVELAALADTIGVVCQGEGALTDRLLNYVQERAHREATMTFVKRAAPRPDSVVPMVRPVPVDEKDE